jgi:hypothetical protein
VAFQVRSPRWLAHNIPVLIFIILNFLSNACECKLKIQSSEKFIRRRFSTNLPRRMHDFIKCTFFSRTLETCLHFNRKIANMNLPLLGFYFFELNGKLSQIMFFLYPSTLLAMNSFARLHYIALHTLHFALSKYASFDVVVIVQLIT